MIRTDDVDPCDPLPRLSKKLSHLSKGECFLAGFCSAWAISMLVFVAFVNWR